MKLKIVIFFEIESYIIKVATKNNIKRNLKTKFFKYDDN